MSNKKTYTQIHTIGNCDTSTDLSTTDSSIFAMKVDGKKKTYDVTLDKRVKIYLDKEESET